MTSSSAFLSLPREIRDQIISQLFFLGELEDTIFERKHKSLAYTARRQISPFCLEAEKRPKFDVAILRACRQLQVEGEAILYGTSSFHLVYDLSHDNPIQPHQFLELFPRRLRRLIRRVELSRNGVPHIFAPSPFEWTTIMKFLAEECSALHTLRVWGPLDPENRFNPPFDDTYHVWIQPILRIETLRIFDMLIEQGDNIVSHPWLLRLPSCLKESLTAERQSSYSKSRSNDDKKPFNLLGLPLELRRMIYRDTLLSDSRRVYIDMKPWFNKNAQDCLSMMLTCKTLHNEVGTIFFAESIFYSHKRRSTYSKCYSRDRSAILERVRRHGWSDGKTDLIENSTAHDKFPLKHLDLVLDLDMNDIFQFFVAPSRSWILQPESLHIRYHSHTANNFVHTLTDYLYFLYDQRDDHRTIDKNHRHPHPEPDIDTEPVTAAERWLLSLIASVPRPTFHVRNHAHHAWLSQRLREQWILGNPCGPGLEWFFQGALQEGD